MALTPTTGCVYPVKFGVAPNYNYGADQIHMSYGFKIHDQPDDYKSNKNNTGYKVTSSQYISSDSVQSVTVFNNINNGEAYTRYNTGGGAVNDWFDNDDDNLHVNSAPLRQWQDNLTTPKAATGALTFDSSDTSNPTNTTQEVRGISVSLDSDTSPKSGEYIEQCGRHPATGSTSYDWAPFDENQPCSAYVMKQLICENTAVIIEQNAGGDFTLPLYDITDSYL